MTKAAFKARFDKLGFSTAEWAALERKRLEQTAKSLEKKKLKTKRRSYTFERSAEAARPAVGSKPLKLK